MSGITYDKQTLRDMKRRLKSVRAGAYIPRLVQLVSVGGVKLTMDTFRKQQDPYGKAWAPLARERTRDRKARLRVEAKGKKARGQKILIDTSRMRNSTTAIVMGKSGGVAIPTGYAASHQGGAHIAPHSRVGVAYYQRGRASAKGSPRIGVARMRENLKGSAASKKIAGFYNSSYANGINIPRRMMLPDSKMGLPESWKKMIRRETTGLLSRIMKKGAQA